MIYGALSIVIKIQREYYFKLARKAVNRTQFVRTVRAICEPDFVVFGHEEIERDREINNKAWG